MPQRARKIAGITVQTMPAPTAKTTIIGMSAASGSLSPQAIMQPAVASAPMSTWPSAPMFQKRILKAGVTARAMHRSMAVFCRVIQILRDEPKLPSIMAA